MWCEELSETGPATTERAHKSGSDKETKRQGGDGVGEAGGVPACREGGSKGHSPERKGVEGAGPGRKSDCSFVAFEPLRCILNPAESTFYPHLDFVTFLHYVAPSRFYLASVFSDSSLRIVECSHLLFQLTGAVFVMSIARRHRFPRDVLVSCGNLKNGRVPSKSPFGVALQAASLLFPQKE